MMFLHNASPMPLPLTLELKNPSNSFSRAPASMPRPRSSTQSMARSWLKVVWMRSRRRSCGRSTISSMALNARLRITWPTSTFSQLTRTGELAGTMSSFTPAS
ncbi:hypothetical protein D3C81_1905870 [compost metagenome]